MYDKSRIDAEAEYFKQVFALAEVGGYTSEEIVSEDAVAQYTTEPEQVEWDVWIIRSAVEDEMLPKAYQDTFEDMYGLGRQADDMQLNRLPEIEEADIDDEKVDELVERSVQWDEEQGFNVDFADELYERRYQGTRLLRKE